MKTLLQMTFLLVVSAASAGVLPIATIGSSYAAHAIDHSLALPAAPLVAAPAAPLVAAPLAAAPLAAAPAAPLVAAAAPAPFFPAPAPFAASYYAPPSLFV